jgi:hypothetical protein
MTMRRCRKMLYALSVGAITLGWLQGWNLINFADFWTQFIISLITTLFSAFLGGTPTVTA